MRSRAWFLPAFIFLASPLWAQPVPPVGDAAMRILAYVPPDADLAVCVRVDQLVRTDFWKRFADPKVGFYQEFVEDLQKEMAVDPEKDVAAVVLFFKLTYEEDGDPDEPRIGFVLALNRDTRPGTFFVKEDGRQPINVPGIPGPVHRPASDMLVAFPDPRTVVVAMSDWLPAVLTAATTLYETPPWPRRELAVPGEITFAGRMPEKLKAAIRTEFEKERRRLLKPHANPERILKFVLLYNLVALALDADSAVGSVNLADSEAALRATLAFGEGRLAPATAAVAQAMADPLAIALPALFGGAPLDKPPDPGAPGLYLVRADAKTVRLAMSRENLEQLVAQMSEGAEGAKERARSANNLHQIGRAVQAFLADQGAYPTSLMALFPKYLTDRRILENPARAVHLPEGDYRLVPLTKEVASKQPWAEVLAYEILSRGEAPQEGLNVLFADGHVEYVTVEAFRRLYQETLKDLGR